MIHSTSGIGMLFHSSGLKSKTLIAEAYSAAVSPLLLGRPLVLEVLLSRPILLEPELDGTMLLPGVVAPTPPAVPRRPGVDSYLRILIFNFC